MFPITRLRRLRAQKIRKMVRETELSVNDLIAPLFVDENITQIMPISSMPGIQRETPKSVVDEATRIK